jgi:hypothetical protein
MLQGSLLFPILFFVYEPLSASLNDAVLKLFMERNKMQVIKHSGAGSFTCCIKIVRAENLNAIFLKQCGCNTDALYFLF